MQISVQADFIPFFLIKIIFFRIAVQYKIEIINNIYKTIAMQFFLVTSLVCGQRKTATIRVSEETFHEVKEMCSELGEAFNFNQFVNQSLSAILEVISHEGGDIPVPRFAMMVLLDERI